MFTATLWAFFVVVFNTLAFTPRSQRSEQAGSTVSPQCVLWPPLPWTGKEKMFSGNIWCRRILVQIFFLQKKFIRCSCLLSLSWLFWLCHPNSKTLFSDNSFCTFILINVTIHGSLDCLNILDFVKDIIRNSRILLETREVTHFLLTTR